MTMLLRRNVNQELTFGWILAFSRDLTSCRTKPPAGRVILDSRFSILDLGESGVVLLLNWGARLTPSEVSGETDCVRRKSSRSR